MIIPQIPNCQLTYCTNIHPGESWQQVLAQLQTNLPAVKKAVAPDQDFGIGARLSAQAVSELTQDNNLANLKEWLTEAGFYIFTVNGFPYGQFHKTVVKEKVYQPDWSHPERLEYSKQLAEVLADLLPTDTIGTISTVPVGLKSLFSKKERLLAARDNLFSMVFFLFNLHQRTGREIKLALEPEPGCYLETSSDIVSFFYEQLLTAEAMDRLKNFSSGVSSPEILLNYLGICLDTCHTSVMLERPTAVARLLKKNHLGIFKVQLTTALSAKKIDRESLTVLQQLSDPVYLHQTTVYNEKGKREFYLDLPDALKRTNPGDNLSVHYHVPVYSKNFGTLQTSQPELTEFLNYFSSQPFCQHLELETYTFDILPADFRQSSVVNNINQELHWVLDNLNP